MEHRAQGYKKHLKKAKSIGHGAEGTGFNQSHRAGRIERRVKSKEEGDTNMAKFRFQDLKIWQLAIEIADELFDIADDLEQRRLYRFADQLRGAGMSMSNNIAEGSGSASKKEFKQFLNMARRSTFENANILILLQKRKLIGQDSLDQLLGKLDSLCRQITGLQGSLK
jgi:four helix bundle protein